MGNWGNIRNIVVGKWKYSKLKSIFWLLLGHKLHAPEFFLVYPAVHAVHIGPVYPIAHEPLMSVALILPKHAKLIGQGYMILDILLLLQYPAWTIMLLPPVQFPPLGHERHCTSGLIKNVPSGQIVHASLEIFSPYMHSRRFIFINIVSL